MQVLTLLDFAKIYTGYYCNIALLRRTDSNRRSPKLFCHAPNVCKACMTYFQDAGCPFTSFLRFLPSFRLSLIWLATASCSPAGSGVSAYIPCARVFPFRVIRNQGAPLSLKWQIVGAFVKVCERIFLFCFFYGFTCRLLFWSVFTYTPGTNLVKP